MPFPYPLGEAPRAISAFGLYLPQYNHHRLPRLFQVGGLCGEGHQCTRGTDVGNGWVAWDQSCMSLPVILIRMALYMAHIAYVCTTSDPDVVPIS
jgi:hypothetical protein